MVDLSDGAACSRTFWKRGICSAVSGKMVEFFPRIRGWGMILYFIVTLSASIVGAICGIGGGVIIKPVLDLLQMDSVVTISFLSGCAVLSMSCYSVGKAVLENERRVSFQTGTPLALGAALGGLAGKELFSAISEAAERQSIVGAVQAVCLAIITLGTLIYNLQKNRIAPRSVKKVSYIVAIGLILGVFSSFLGIGGGPINLVVLNYFFGMDTKTAAANSLYIILFSQTASLLSSVITGTVPVFHPVSLLLMVSGGIVGGVIGRKLNRKMDNRAVDRLFAVLLVVIIVICIYNAWRYGTV